MSGAMTKTLSQKDCRNHLGIQNANGTRADACDEFKKKILKARLE